MSAPQGLAPAASQAQRRAQNRARLRDAMRLLPFLGLALFVLPDLVLSGGPAAEGATRPWLTYLFLAWIGLIAMAVTLALLHLHDGADPSDKPDG